MNGPAIAMMIVSMLVIWGGLGLAVLNLTRFRGAEPEETIRDL